MGKRKDYEAVLKILSEGSRKSDEFLAILVSKLPPNIKGSVLGGKANWIDLAESNGWKLQQNTIMKNVRIIDNNNKRRAFSWNPSRLLGVMDELVRELHGQGESTGSFSENESMADVLAGLEYLSQLHDMRVITDEEYEKKKKEILERI